MTIANRMSERLDSRGGKAVVDVVGVGGGPVDRLREMGHDVVAFNGAQRTDVRDESGEFGFPNVRSAAWWNMRELLDPSSNTAAIALPPDEFLVADLTAPRYRVATGAKIVIEEKKDTKRRLRRSPDTGDSVVMSFWFSGLDSSVGDATVIDYGAQSEYSVAWAPSTLFTADETYTTSFLSDEFLR
jgi:hypothetical protein